MRNDSDYGIASGNAPPSNQAAPRLLRAEKIRIARESRASAARREAVRLVGALLNDETNLGARFGNLAAAVRERFEADCCAFLCLDSLGASRLARALRQHPRHGRACHSDTPSGTEQVTVDSVVVTGSDAPLDVLRDHSMVSCLHKYVHSLGTDRLFGVLSVQQRTPRRFGAGDVALLDAIGALITAALDRGLSVQSPSSTPEELSAR